VWPIVIVAIVIATSCFAETVVLKSGEKIEGKILQKTDSYIKVDFQGIPLTFYLDEIKIIEPEKLGFTTKEPATYEINDEEILDKIEEARKRIKRVRLQQINEVSSELFNIKVEKISDFDLKNRIGHFIIQTKYFKLFFPEISDDPSKELMERMSKAFTKIKQEAFLVDDAFYMNLEDTWAKFKLPWSGFIWDRKKTLEESYRKDITEALPPTLKQTIEPFFATAIGDFYDLKDIYSIKEGFFSNELCYVLSVKTERVLESTKESFLNYVESSGRHQDLSDISVEDFSYNEFVSKDDYSRRGLEINLRVIAFSQQLKRQLNLSMGLKEFYSYPQDELKFSTEERSVIEIKDEVELKRFLEERLKNKMVEVLLERKE